MIQWTQKFVKKYCCLHRHVFLICIAKFSIFGTGSSYLRTVFCVMMFVFAVCIVQMSFTMQKSDFCSWRIKCHFLLEYHERWVFFHINMQDGRLSGQNLMMSLKYMFLGKCHDIESVISPHRCLGVIQIRLWLSSIYHWLTVHRIVYFLLSGLMEIREIWTWVN